MLKQIFCNNRSILLNMNFSRYFKSYFNLEQETQRLNKQKQFKQVLDLFQNDKNQQFQSDRIVVQLLKACIGLNNMEFGIEIDKRLPNHLRDNVYIQSQLIQFYMQFGDVKNAERIFSSSIKKTMFHYGSMMKGYLKNQMATKGIDLFLTVNQPDEILLVLLFNSCTQVKTNKALKIGQKVASEMSSIYHQNQYIVSSLLNMFVQYEDVSNAEYWFSKRESSIIAHGEMMKCYNRCKLPMKTINIYRQIQKKQLKIDLIIYLLLCEAGSQIGIQSICQWIKNEIPNTMLNDIRIQTALIHMWGKAGCIDRAKHLFDIIIQPNHVAYTAMINSFGLNGMGSDAIDLFRRMPSSMIVDQTYVCILNACSHSGLVDEARSIFSTIKNKEEIIYTTMVDCLSRSFFFEEAQQLIEEFELDHSPSIQMYICLLSAARNQRNKDLARKILERMKNLFPNQDKSMIAATILTVNTLASAGESDEASTIRWNLMQSGARKEIGLSWTEVNGKIVQFRAHDRSHPNSSAIYDELDRIMKELIEHGHKFDPSWITRPMMPDETVESILNSHSERLAIAFNFIQRPTPNQIQLTKNLRICGDCHAAIKLISRIRHCDIIVRDSNRIHHFHNGQCSCHDHF